MSLVFITGSTEGLGRNAAETLIEQGHRVVLHARTRERADALADLLPRTEGIVIGDLSQADEVVGLAEQVNRLGKMDAIIHNAGVYTSADRLPTSEGHARTLAVNVLAPYLLTTMLDRPQRLVFLSSGLHKGGKANFQDINWHLRTWNEDQAYAESKLYVTALALAIARHWPDVKSNAVNPGWVPTRMGGQYASDDLNEGHLTQTWLAVSNDSAALTSGGYWFHHQRHAPASLATETEFQDQLLSVLAELTGIPLR
ncbi:SDR family NAD(P)-dependent oxidoreductase [Pantoea coffeiphila]|uniref:Daunorubicin C-13 ketoreductase n=1 Tax=Pantoea coffeiphila TaxID=1465635 RepID=A0A2S9I748_9GAMM|nr:SDR family NAD(P)-dependent oxidoreductase [Pantoea coffeiphila]PRD13627.1 daunorubicin C-13 ketoreductase [Pantoea coffeiphila]